MPDNAPAKPAPTLRDPLAPTDPLAACALALRDGRGIPRREAERLAREIPEKTRQEIAKQPRTERPRLVDGYFQEAGKEAGPATERETGAAAHDDQHHPEDPPRGPRKPRPTGREKKGT